MTEPTSASENIVDREIVNMRLLDAPRELVYEAFTTAKHAAVWWEPNGCTNTIHAMHVRPGGMWRFIMHGPDGTDYGNRIVFREVVKPERLVFDHGSDIDNDPDLFHVTVTFEPEGNQMRIMMRSLFATKAARDAVMKFGAVAGVISRWSASPNTSRRPYEFFRSRSREPSVMTVAARFHDFPCRMPIEIPQLQHNLRRT